MYCWRVKKPKAKQGTPARQEALAAPAISGRRARLLRLALATFPFVLLLAVELTLRMLGRGYPTAAILCSQENGQRWCHDNSAFGRLFFPSDVARYCPPFRFPATKPPNTCRIFILGESAAEGYPEAGISFGRILEVMLRQSYPNSKFEVITIAMSAIDSQAFPLMARECAKYSPDLFIV